MVSALGGVISLMTLLQILGYVYLVYLLYKFGLENTVHELGHLVNVFLSGAAGQ